MKISVGTNWTPLGFSFVIWTAFVTRLWVGWFFDNADAKSDTDNFCNFFKQIFETVYLRNIKFYAVV